MRIALHGDLFWDLPPLTHLLWAIFMPLWTRPSSELRPLDKSRPAAQIAHYFAAKCASSSFAFSPGALFKRRDLLLGGLTPEPDLDEQNIRNPRHHFCGASELADRANGSFPSFPLLWLYMRHVHTLFLLWAC